jgi:hypothetical protein
VDKKESGKASQFMRIVKDNLQVYYSNCAMVSTTPMDLNIYLGRFVPTQNDKGEQVLAELYEQQVVLTFEQARNLARGLVQTLQMLDSARENVVNQGPNTSTNVSQSVVQKSPVSKPTPGLIKEDLELEID